MVENLNREKFFGRDGRCMGPGAIKMVTPYAISLSFAAISDRGAGFKSLKDAWADTTSAHGRLMLTVLGGLAEFERELIRARTGEGRKRAKERGVRFGRPRKLTPHQRQEALQRLAAGETQADVARTFNVDATTIGRLLVPALSLAAQAWPASSKKEIAPPACHVS